MVDTRSEHATLTFETDGCVMAYHNDISIVVWAKQADAELANQFAALIADVARAHPRMSTVQILAPGAAVPTPEAREIINGLIVQYAPRLIGCAALLEGTGFWASAMRSFLTSLQLFRRGGFTTKICASQQEAATWLAPLHSAAVGVSVSPTELQAAMTQLRDRPSVTR